MKLESEPFVRVCDICQKFGNVIHGINSNPNQIRLMTFNQIFNSLFSIRIQDRLFIFQISNVMNSNFVRFNLITIFW